MTQTSIAIADNPFREYVEPKLLARLKALSWVSLSLQTTAKSFYVSAGRINNEMTIGDKSWLQYRAETPKASRNTRPRVRILTVYHDSIGSISWDLDQLEESQRKDLLDAVLEGKTVLTRDASSALGWLFIETRARPRFVLDVSLLLKQIKPSFRLRPFNTKGDQQLVLNLESLLKARGSSVSSVAWDAFSCKLPYVPADFDQPLAWAVSPLSSTHFEYAQEQERLQRAILDVLLPDTPIGDATATIAADYPWYMPYSGFSIVLAEAHARGTPLDINAMSTEQERLREQVEREAQFLGEIPEFKDLLENLLDIDRGETDDLKTALSAHATRYGAALEKTDKDKIATGAAAVIAAGAASTPAWLHYNSLRAAKCMADMLNRFEQASRLDGRLHSILSVTTETGRISSSAPALQNIPRESQFRSLIHAKDGYVIVSADYAAIELVIAAALAQRMVEDLNKLVGENDTSEFVSWVRQGLDLEIPLPLPNPGDTATDVSRLARVVMQRSVQMMASVFKRGLDPHDLTALQLIRQQGHVSFSGSALAQLKLLQKQPDEALIAMIKSRRPQAKSLNFGLLYGQGAEGLHRMGIESYGLDWTFAEAKVARTTWFTLYPEFKLFQMFTKYFSLNMLDPQNWFKHEKSSRTIVPVSKEARIFKTTTMTRRPLVTLDNTPQALNHQNQGTCADIIALAVDSLPPPIAGMLLFPVHDELVFEVPRDALDQICTCIEAVMVQAAKSVLGPEAPVKVNLTSGVCWSKG